MKVIKRSKDSIAKEDAHGGTGSRKVYVDSQFSDSPHLDAITHGYLPAGNVFDWHDHTDIEEVMIVLKGSGQVSDEDGEYSYGQGDVFVFPANVQHKISNASNEENEMIFIRVNV
jgi:quercetin dioxygenase-like cupin family protein